IQNYERWSSMHVRHMSEEEEFDSEPETTKADPLAWDFDTVKLAPKVAPLATNKPVADAKAGAGRPTRPAPPAPPYQSFSDTIKQYENVYSTIVNPVLRHLQSETNHHQSKSALESIRASFERAERELPGITQRILHECLERIEDGSF